MKLTSSPIRIISAAMLALAATAVASCDHGTKVTPAPPVAVKVVAVSGAGAPSGRSFSGTVEAATSTPVSFSVPGTITEMLVEEGQHVARGQVIARIKSESLVNDANIADAALAEARDAYGRLKKLHDADALPDIKWVEAQQTLKQAENAAEIARRAVADATVTAPVEGVVSHRFADKGQTVAPAEPVVEIVSLGRLRIAVAVPEEEISSVADGSAADITIASLDGLRVEGRNAVKAVVADPLTRSYTVKYDIPANPGGRILPGMIADVTLAAALPDSAASPSRAVTLPPQALLLGSDNRTFVWVVDGSRAERRYVTAEGLETDGVTVTAGLAPGDSVIVAGMQKVCSGTPVTIAAR